MAEGANHFSEDNWSGGWFVCDADVAPYDAVQALQIAMGYDVPLRLYAIYDDLDFLGEAELQSTIAMPEQTATGGLARALDRWQMPPTTL